MEARSEDKVEPESVADVLGPWVEVDFQSGLITRCKAAWSKRFQDLTNEELATLLRQRSVVATAVKYLLREASFRLENKVDDDTEMYEGELREAIRHAKGMHEIIGTMSILRRRPENAPTAINV